MSKTYRVEEYAADGHAGEPGLHRSDHSTLDEARATVRSLLGVKRLSPARKWSGYTDEPGVVEIESYHMFAASHPRADGCGGYAILRQ